MNLFKSLFFSSVSSLNIEWLKKHSPIDILIPYHHLVSDEPVPYIQNLYSFKNVRQFESDLDYLLEHFEPVSLTDIIEHQKNDRPFKSKSFLLTFDDGLRQVYETIMPLLLRKGVPAALFINPAFVDNNSVSYDFKKGLILHKLQTGSIAQSIINKIQKIIDQKISTYNQLYSYVQTINYGNQHIADSIANVLEIDFINFLKQQKPFMTTEQIQIFINKGFHLGAHSIDHPLYSLISLQQQIDQTKISVDWVCKKFNLTYRVFAFPHLDKGVSYAFFNALLNEKEFSLDLVLGNNTAMKERQSKVLHRFIGENPLIPAKTMIKAILSYSIVRKALGKSFVNRTTY
ncbi:MAG: hypothetical protein NVS1B13_26820 [Flavisolibacter sp.]